MKDRRDFLKKLSTVTAGIMLPLPAIIGFNYSIHDRLGEIPPKRKFG